MREAISDPSLIISLPDSSKKISALYIDGLGRPIQTVIKQNTSHKDLVSPLIYDSYGLNSVDLLPYVSEENTGKFKKEAFSAQRDFFSSLYPDDNVPYSSVYYGFNSTIRCKPGNSFQGYHRGITETLLTNNISEQVRKWDINSLSPTPSSVSLWTQGTLSVKEVMDDAGRTVRNYYDKEGKIILSKTKVDATASTSHDGWACTYYVYDELNRLRTIIPPLAVSFLNDHSWTFTDPSLLQGLCYSYSYDALGNVISKIMPGIGNVSVICDSFSRPILLQDGNLRVTNKWYFIKYDIRGRAILTGQFQNSSGYTESTLRTLVSSSSTDAFAVFIKNNVVFNTYDTSSAIYDCEIYSITYFDNYDHLPPYLQFSPDAVSLVPDGTNVVNDPLSMETDGNFILGFTRVMNGTATSAQWLSRVNFYGQSGRIIQIKEKNINNGIDTFTFKYNFEGLKTGSVSSYANPAVGCVSHVPTLRIIRKYYYDNDGRINTVYQKSGNEDGYRQLCSLSYDDLGRVTKKSIGLIETQKYSYRIWGDLEAINKEYCISGGTNFFGEIINYDFGYEHRNYGGMPCGVKWRLKGSNNIQRSYGYGYDLKGRLNYADYNQTVDGGTAWLKTSQDYSAKGILYDLNGNLINMKQWGTSPAYSTPFLMDDLTYTYNGGGYSNKLIAVDDAVTTYFGLHEFRELDGHTVSDYAYDANGNLTTDANKRIATIKYNMQNKPYLILFTDGRKIEFIYDASGNLLKKNITDVSANTQIDYIGELEYHNNVLMYANNPEGRIRPVPIPQSGLDTSIAFEYDYFIKDHQANVRSVVTEKISTNWWLDELNSNVAGGPLRGPIEISPITGYSGDIAGLFVKNTDYIATNEMSLADAERNFFYNIDSTRDKNPFPQNNFDQFVSRLNANENKVIGPCLLLRVMAGDSISCSTDCNSLSSGDDNEIVCDDNKYITNLFEALSGKPSLPFLSTSEGKIDLQSVYAAQKNMSSLLQTLQQTMPVDPQSPQGFLNYVLLDETMQPVIEASGYIQAHNAVNWSHLDVPIFQVPVSGYILVYVSNRSSKSILFDNIRVSHFKGELQSENHYYPYGLTITSNALTTTIANYTLYKSGQLNNGDFSDGSGLELYNFNARFYDPQVGRWNSSDPLAEDQNSFSNYHYCYGNPVIYSDPNGKKPLARVADYRRGGTVFIPSILGELYDGFAGSGGADNLSGLTTINFITTFNPNVASDMTFNAYKQGGVRPGGDGWYVGNMRIDNNNALFLMNNGAQGPGTAGLLEKYTYYRNADALGALMSSTTVSYASAAAMQYKYAMGYLTNGTLWNSNLKGLYSVYSASDNIVYWNSLYNLSPQKTIEDDSSPWGTAFSLGFSWASGTGPTNMVFINDNVANSFSDARVVKQARNYWYTQVKSGKKSIFDGVSNFRGRKAWTGGNFGAKGVWAAGLDPMEQYVGSFTPTITSDGTTLTFELKNTTSFKSLMYGIAPDWDRTSFGPGGNTEQTYIFSEPIDFKKLEK